ncbi:cupredoxin family copper-binding protein [Streptomyces violaceoruber]|uniref:Secreted metal-binding protein n=2 Tax=Streptomyces TaxID=1883 RepID=Q9EWQ3_STRCO|nr:MULTISPECIES: cupredoxin family copper-binding protein [Streptomyces]MDX2924262.1 cupredoxin family copper-binding protein [Streptomyces sp. NRRL_B-16638]MDX3315478.1 cupredoxin family copper-binding protein [Streptomyces sp. ME03-5684b]MDX3344328.1 cupredoxin family copper-binding protein [Streptomyces sp. ME02-6979A]MDX3399050.1 cupredoxin family copper-binding protein [Streptomyces sp. ME01-18h]MDX3406648.1 cupredoxin family copper-binding protein [Streptomyces sp. ME02-6977A]
MPFPFPTGAARLAAAACALALTALVGCSDGGGGGGGGATESATRSSASGGTQVTIKDFTFEPASLTVSPGAKVTVVNKDSTTHTLTASKGGSFDTGDIAPGKSATFTAPSTAGDFPYACTIHPFMKGTLTVE